MRNSILKASVVSTIVLAGLLSATVNAGTLYATRNGTTLFQVDTSDASLSTVGNYAPAHDGEAIAFHPTSGNLFRWSGNNDTTVSTIDPANSFTESFVVYDSNVSEITSATWDSANGHFFLTNVDGQWRTMSSAGAFSTETFFPNGEVLRGVAFVGSTLYALEHANTFDAGVVDLLTIDPSTGDILDNVDINIPGYSGDGAFGLAYDPDTSTLYAALGTTGDPAGRILAAIDPMTGDGVEIGAFSTNGINSLAVIPNPIPEPTTLALLGSATMLMIRRKR